MHFTKFNEEQLFQINEMYKLGYKLAEMSDKIGINVTNTNLFKIRKYFGTEPRKGKIMNDILSQSGEILNLSNEGYTTIDICRIMNFGINYADSFQIWIPGFKTKKYRFYGPVIQSGIVFDYLENLLSLGELAGKYKMDEGSARAILIKNGALRTRDENYITRKKLGFYTRQRTVDTKNDKTFSANIKTKIRELFDNKCVCCGEKNECHLKRTNKSLNVHHIYPYSACRENLETNLIPLCYDCHKIVHKIMSQSKSIYKTLGSHYRDGLDMSELFFDLFDTDRIADLKIASLDLGST